VCEEHFEEKLEKNVESEGETDDDHDVQRYEGHASLSVEAVGV
jgi:hypothetical protein